MWISHFQLHPLKFKISLNFLFHCFFATVFVSICKHFRFSRSATEHDRFIGFGCLLRTHSDNNNGYYFNKWLFYSIFFIFPVSVTKITMSQFFDYFNFSSTIFNLNWIFVAVIVDTQIQHIRRLSRHTNYLHRMKYPFTMVKRYSFMVYRVSYIFVDLWRQCMSFALLTMSSFRISSNVSSFCIMFQTN